MILSLFKQAVSRSSLLRFTLEVDKEQAEALLISVNGRLREYDDPTLFQAHYVFGSEDKYHRQLVALKKLQHQLREMLKEEE